MVTPQHSERGLMSLTTNRLQISKRRSSRIALNTSVGLSGQDIQKCPFTMPAKATNLNRHGAAIQLPRQLLVGSTVMVRNARGTQVSARVVAQLAVSQGLSIYGIEFLQQDDTTNSFWGITFPALEGRTSGAQAADQIGIAGRRRGMLSLRSQLS
jgi:PilZ domain